jgi:hypothetical protein
MERESSQDTWLLHQVVADVVQAEACFHPAWPLPAPSKPYPDWGGAICLARQWQ